MTKQIHPNNVTEAQRLITALERFMRGKPSNVQTDIHNAIEAIRDWLHTQSPK